MSQEIPQAPVMNFWWDVQNGSFDSEQRKMRCMLLTWSTWFLAKLTLSLRKSWYSNWNVPPYSWSKRGYTFCSYSARCTVQWTNLIYRLQYNRFLMNLTENTLLHAFWLVHFLFVVLRYIFSRKSVLVHVSASLRLMLLTCSHIRLARRINFCVSYHVL